MAACSGSNRCRRQSCPGAWRWTATAGFWAPVGSIRSTIEDFARLAIGIIDGAVVTTDTLYRQMWVRNSDVSGGYGLGFAIDPSIGLTTFETNGGTAPDGKSLGGYSNPEFDQWVRKAETAKSEEERTRCFHEAEKVLLKDVAAIPVWAMRYVYAWNKKVQGVRVNDVWAINVTNPWTNMWMEQ